MASQTRQAREADRKLSVQTLAIASISSALAAVIVSQFWKSGTAPAAAITPVVVTVLSEMLHKPTQAIKPGDRRAHGPPPRGRRRRRTRAEDRGGGGRTRRRPRGGQAGVGGAASAPTRRGRRRRPQRRAGFPRGADQLPQGRLATAAPRRPFENLRKRVSLKIVAATAALAFVIGAAILTVPELIAGGSVGKTSGGTTLFGGDRSSTQEREQGRERRRPTAAGSALRPELRRLLTARRPDPAAARTPATPSARRRPETEQQKSTQQKQPQQQRAPATPQQAPAQP